MLYDVSKIKDDITNKDMINKVQCGFITIQIIYMSGTYFDYITNK